ncbi:MAG: sigma 54-interacting transcriptional regulator [Deltaproteobacteria bacterium]|nr:sigma 54-interacting transcriptional regulator [Deltaproteobacteria bacterium]
MQRVLIVEPDPALAELLAGCVRAAGWRVDTAPSLDAALAGDPGAFTLVLTDLADDADVAGLERLCRRPDAPAAIGMGERDRLALAVRALRGGARAFLGKPFDVRALERALAAAAGQHARGPLAPHFAPVPGDPAMQALVREAEAAARADATVAIVGEAATGRRRLARYLHAASSRRDGPLMELDARELDQAGSVLLGDGGGTQGALAAARDGTLVLVEPGALSPVAQARLLAGLGAGAAPRVVVICERPLGPDARLRAELRLRLDVVRLFVPPLRERPNELARLAVALGERFAAAQGVAPPRLGAAALAALCQHPFPGNLRELENLMQRAVLWFPGEAVDVAALLAPHAAARARRAAAAPVLDLRALERRAVEQALALCAGNRTRAARALGISVRTLRNKLHHYGLV